MTPSTNKTLQLAVTATDQYGNPISGTLDFQLFDNYAGVDAITSHIESLVSSGFYNNLQFFRILNPSTGNGILQAGSPTNNGQGGSGTSFDDAYNPDLRFNTTGVLAMAKSGNDGNDSQFFITSSVLPGYNFRYTAVGFLTSGSDFLTQLANVTTVASTNFSGETSQPQDPVTITSATIINDTQDGVMILNCARRRGRTDGNRHDHDQRRHAGRHGHQDADGERQSVRLDDRFALLDHQYDHGRAIDSRGSRHPRVRRPVGDDPELGGLSSLGGHALFRHLFALPIGQQLFEFNRRVHAHRSERLWGCVGTGGGRRFQQRRYHEFQRPSQLR